MTLHGDLKVNGDPILTWAAQRIVDGIDGGPNLYTVALRSEQWGVPDEPFIIEHQYDDGALVLAQKVLAHYRVWMEH